MEVAAGAPPVALALAPRAATLAAWVPPEAGEPACDLTLIVASLTPLAHHAAALRRLTHTARHARAAARCARAALDAAATAAADADKARNSLLASFDKVLGDHGDTDGGAGGGAASLRTLALTGTPTPGLAAALGGAMPGYAGVRASVRAVDAAAAAVHTALRRGAAPAVAALAHWLGQAAALAVRPPPGWEGGALEEASAAARDAVARVAAAADAAVDAAAAARATGLWLLHVASAATGAGEGGDDAPPPPPPPAAVAAAAAALDGGGPAAAELRAALGDTTLDPSTDALAAIPPALRSALGPPARPGAPARVLVDDAEAAVARLVDGVAAALGASVACAPTPARVPGPAVAAAVSVVEDDTNNTECFVGAVATEGGRTVTRVCVVAGTAGDPPSSTPIPLPPASRAIDVGVYRGGDVALLLDDGETATLTVVATDDDTTTRSRAIPGGDPAPPLTLSAPRGVAAVVTAGGARVTLLDLEDEDGGEEGEQGGDDDDDASADDGESE